MTALRITNQGFLSEFLRRHQQMQDRPFCWILGAGASYQSGIPTGGALVQLWLQELHELEDHKSLPIEEWATADTLGIRGFEYKRAETFYPWVYQRRFRDYKEQGYAFLEKVMERAEPSFGYSILAQVMAGSLHSVAITTNFDNLLADALSIYTRTFPLVCGHESLTGYIRPNLRRPLIAKIHRDLLLAPLSNPEEIAALPDEWAAALTKILGRFTPVVIGYGGNDGTLMGFLKRLEPIEGGIFWCYRAQGSADVDANIQAVVEHHRGRLVPIAGFDEFMLQLREQLKLPSLVPQLQEVHDKRIEGYQKQFENLTAALKKPAENPALEQVRQPAREAAAAAVERLTKEGDWWAWNLKVQAAHDPPTKEALYRQAIKELPDSVPLLTNFADYLRRQRKNSDEAEALFRRAIGLKPRERRALGCYATFLAQVRKDYDAAIAMNHRAMEGLRPEDSPLHATFNANMAQIMFLAQRTPEATELLRQLEVAMDVPADAALEASFYRAAHVPAAWPSELSKLKALLSTGMRSLEWDLSGNVEVATRAKHPNPQLLQAIAAVIGGESPLESLELFPEWKEAP